MGFVNRALGALLAIALVVIGAVTLFEIGAVVVGADPMVAPHDRWLSELSRQAWGERATRLACIGLIVAGLALVALQLLRQRPAEVAAASGAPLPARVPRRDLEREVAAELRQVEGVATAAVKLRRRGLDVKASVIAGEPQALRESLAVAARRAMTARGADAGGPVKVDVRLQPARES
jgi:hypothetical protein